MILSTGIKNHLKPLLFSIPILLPLGIMVYFLQLGSFGVLVLALFYGPFLISSLYIHWEYYLQNRGQKIELLSDEIVLHKSNGDVQRVKFSDIEKIIVSKSANLDKGGIQVTPIDTYHYARIIPKQGETIIITSLIAPDVEAVIKKIGKYYERQKRLFSTL